MNSTKNKNMSGENQKKVYTCVYAGEDPNKANNAEENKKKMLAVRKKRDSIHNEIMGEFSRYGIKVHY